MDFNLNDKQSLRMAKCIRDAGFRLHGIGHFDVNTEEMANIIKLAFGRNSRDRTLDYYYELRRKAGL